MLTNEKRDFSNAYVKFLMTQFKANIPKVEHYSFLNFYLAQVMGTAVNS